MFLRQSRAQELKDVSVSGILCYLDPQGSLHIFRVIAREQEGATVKTSFLYNWANAKYEWLKGRPYGSDCLYRIFPVTQEATCIRGMRSRAENMMFFFFFFFFWPHLPADVPCNVVAALPVPLGQRVCDSAVPGHFLRHHPAAPWSEARSNHRPHDRWVSSSLLWLPEGFHLQQAGFKWPAVWMITHLYKTLFKLNQAIVSMFLYWQPVN